MAEAEQKLANGAARIDFATSPSRYRHWKLTVDGKVATLVLDVDEKGSLFAGYDLKLNSYDLGVDIELADAFERIRFEHPQVRVIVLRSGKPRVFCAGANIRMLAGASHAHKVNFCKFTNETRNAIEDASEASGLSTICVINGTAAGGGYELALAADHIMLVDDGSSAVSLPELPLLAVLPGTGGLTRVTDKRKVRRDRADVFCTTEEGIKGKRAVDWRLVDEVVPASRLEEAVTKRAREFAAKSPRPAAAKGIALTPLKRERSADAVEYSTLSVELERASRRATITLRGPEAPPPASAEAIVEAGAQFWPLRLARELNDAILDIRANEFEVAAIIFKSSGDPAQVLAYEEFLEANTEHWLAREIRAFWKRVLKRVDLTSRSLVALVEPGSCFAGTLAELVFASDRSYMLIGQRDGDNKPPASLALAEVNFGAYPMSNGLSRLASRFLADAGALEKAKRAIGERLDAETAESLGLVTFALDDIDWEDEIRVFLEERASFSPDALTGLEANLRFGGPETMESKIFARLTAWQNWIFQRPNAVNLTDDRQVLRALERWHPGYIDWWKDMGPQGFQDSLVYLRTAVSVDSKGWAKFDYVKMPDYRWGILLAPKEEDRKIPFGRHYGEPAWQDIPGEYRAMLRRLVVIQGDTEPASVEQQRHLGKTAPSLYDMRNVFQVNVEEGRHMWAMVYVLQKYFGRDGREEAEQLLQRRSGDPDKPRMLGAFNEATPDWLSFHMFTFFTDRDGKMQLESLAQSGFDPLSRTCRFMLTEEAHHMFVGETGIGRTIQRTCEAMKAAGIEDPSGITKVRDLGAIDLPTIQKKLNLHYSLSLDLFGSEVSTNAANAFNSGVKGRYHETQINDDHRLQNSTYPVLKMVNGEIKRVDEPALTALNMRLRDDYTQDCVKGLLRWNKIITLAGYDFKLTLPNVAFHRQIGEFRDIHATPDGVLIDDATWSKRKGEWLPSADDGDFIASLMTPVTEVGQFAPWISPPKVGIDNKPGDFEYVKIET